MIYPLHPKYSASLAQKNVLVENEISHIDAQHKHGIDVIFVHGLRGSLFKTWRTNELKNEDEPKNDQISYELNQSNLIKSLTNVSKKNDYLIGKLNNLIESHINHSSHSNCFPKDWLPEILSDNDDSVRILGINYDTLYTLWGEDLIDDKKLKFSIKQRAVDLSEQFKLARVGENNRPVLFVCHSMGGKYAFAYFYHFNPHIFNVSKKIKKVSSLSRY